MLKIVTDDTDRDDLALMLDELVVEGARRMLLAGLEIEVADYIERHCHLVDGDGRRLVVRNGKAAERTMVTGAGGLKIRAPRVDDRRDGFRFSSYILPQVRSPVSQGRRCVAGVVSAGPVHRGTSLQRWRSSSAQMRGCRRRRSPD
jgi:hypothetical protein